MKRMPFIFSTFYSNSKAETIIRAADIDIILESFYRQNAW